MHLIVACSENGAIGKDGGLPWRLSGDLQLFKQLTLGHIVVMGRKTFESLKKPLPGRFNVVLTRDRLSLGEQQDIAVVSKPEDIHGLYHNFHLCEDKKIFIIGGHSLYELFLSQAQYLHYTKVYATIDDADTFFPKMSWDNWRMIQSQFHQQDDKNQYAWEYQLWINHAYQNKTM